MQVGAIIWYCVFIWMEHACCVQVLSYYVYLHVMFLSHCQKGLIHFVLFLMRSEFTSRRMKYEQINAACSQIQWTKRPFYLISHREMTTWIGVWIQGQSHVDKMYNFLWLECYYSSSISIDFILQLQCHYIWNAGIVWHFRKYTYLLFFAAS